MPGFFPFADRPENGSFLSPVPIICYRGILFSNIEDSKGGENSVNQFTAV